MNLKTRAIGAVGALVMASGMAAFVAPAANAVDTPAGTCVGSKSLGKLTPGLGDQTLPVTVSTALLKDLSTNTAIGGACIGLVVRSDNPGGQIPGGFGVLTPKAISSKLSGISSCAQGDHATPGTPSFADATYANRYALTGKQIVTMTTTDALAKPWQIQAYITIKGFVTGTQDIVSVTGLVVKGPSVGATVSGTLYEDPISKLGPTSNAGPALPKPYPAGYTGYGLDILTGNPLGCTNTIPGDASITQIQVGDGTSLLAASASGLSFAFIGV